MVTVFCNDVWFNLSGSSVIDLDYVSLVLVSEPINFVSLVLVLRFSFSII